MDWRKTKSWRLAKWVFRSIVPDLLCFTAWELTGLVIFAATSVVFSFISFNHIYDPVNYPSIYNAVNDRLFGIEPWRRNMMCTSGAASFTGVLSVVLTTKGKITCFFWGAINSLLYGLFAYAYGYAGDAQLNLFFFFPVQFLGVYLWGEDMIPDREREEEGKKEQERTKEQGTGDNEKPPLSPASVGEGQIESEKEKEKEEESEIDADVGLTVTTRRMSYVHWIVCLLCTAAISIAFYYEIPVFARRISGIYYFDSQPAPHIIDAVTNALSMVAQVLCLWQYAEQWYWWIAVDALQITMYTGIAGYGIVINVVVMWVLFTCNALAGLYAWHVRSTDKEETAAMGGSRSANDECVKSESACDTVCDVESQKNPVCVSIGGVDLSDPHCTSCVDPFACDNALHGFSQPTHAPEMLMHTENTPLPLPGNRSNNDETTTRKRRGLIVGKFWPFHRGHEYLCQRALSHCDELYIIVCDRPYHTPTGAERARWIREAIPTARIMVIRDVYDPLDSSLWASLCSQWCQRAGGFHPDVVFTSEQYGEPWAKALHCEHVLVDVLREHVPISGTAIRANPIQQWEFLTSAGKEYYARRVVLVGSESTGKSTLALHLARLFDAPCVTEYGRELCEKKLSQQPAAESGDSAAVPEFGEWTDEDFEDIIRTQAARENTAARDCRHPGLVFCDTNIFATLIWYERYMERPVPPHLRKLFAELYVPPALYLLLTVEGSVFVQDGYRDGEAIRDEMEDKFAHTLSAQDVPFVRLSGSFAERTKAAEELIRERFIK